MELISDRKRAERLARVIMDNLGLYEEGLVKSGINSDNIFDLMHDHIEESRREFNSRVIPELAATNIFDLALCDVLIKRAYKHRTPECSAKP